jgi:hypothetical protein
VSELANYAVGQNVLLIGRAKIEGFGKDVSVKVKRAKFSETIVGLDGRVTRSVSSDQTAVITVTLMQTSPAMPVMEALVSLMRGEGGANGADVGAFFHRDAGRGKEYSARQCWLEEQGDEDYGATAGEVEFTFMVADLQVTYPAAT